MVANKLSKSQLLARRMDRVEEASADLERAAESWTLTNRSLWDIRHDRMVLRKVARAYASAVRALARATQ